MVLGIKQCPFQDTVQLSLLLSLLTSFLSCDPLYSLLPSSSAFSPSIPPSLLFLLRPLHYFLLASNPFSLPSSFYRFHLYRATEQKVYQYVLMRTVKARLLSDPWSCSLSPTTTNVGIFVMCLALADKSFLSCPETGGRCEKKKVKVLTTGKHVKFKDGQR